jgi:hypothetical protein
LGGKGRASKNFEQAFGAALSGAHELLRSPRAWLARLVTTTPAELPSRIFQKIEVLEHYLGADGEGTNWTDNRELVMLAGIKVDLKDELESVESEMRETAIESIAGAHGAMEFVLAFRGARRMKVHLHSSAIDYPATIAPSPSGLNVTVESSSPR